MSDTLLVPMTLEILLVNQALRGRDTFRAWRHTYDALRSYCSPEARAFDANFEDARTGAFLHWTLPRSLRASQPGSTTDFPLVPNRWLINRVSTGPPSKDPTGKDLAGETQLKSWVLESDYLQRDAAGASYYLVEGTTLTDWNRLADGSHRLPVQATGLASGAPWSPTAPNDAYPVNIGRAFDLAAWQETTPRPAPFLTAVAPGNLEFSAYVPFNEGVFSFFDELRVEKGPGKLPDGTTLSYQVIGWYADAAHDIVATGPTARTKTGQPKPEKLADVLAALNWQLAGDPLPASASSLYAGQALGLSWSDKALRTPRPDELENTRWQQQHNVALANNSLDAFSTLVGTQLQVKGLEEDPTQVIELLRAFHYDLLPVLDQPNGHELLSEQTRQQWFSSRAGGTRWTIVAKQAAGPPATPATAAPGVGLTPTPAEAQLLLDLNQAQQALEQAVAELTSLQWQLHAAWWKQGYFGGVGQPSATAAYPLAPQQQALVDQVVAKLKEVNDWQALVPPVVPDAGDSQAFADVVEAFAATKRAASPDANFLKDKLLKPVAEPRYWLPNNPTVVISQMQPSEITKPDTGLVVHLVKPVTDSSASGPIPPLNALPNALPAGVAGAFQEFCTAMLSSPLPNQWQQQWHPLYLEWEVRYLDIPLLDPANYLPNWYFTGTDYALMPKVSATQSYRALSGRSLLSPSAQLTFGDRLKKFINTPGADPTGSLAHLGAEVKAVDDWAFLSQELVGFNDLLTQRDTRLFRRPQAETGPDKDGHLQSLAQLTGYPGKYDNAALNTPAYAQGLVNSVPAIAPRGKSVLPFHAVRSGQLYLSHLTLYDKFGRTLELIVPDSAGLLDAALFPLVRDAAVLPDPNLAPTVFAPVQLPPRLLQPARLDLLLVDHKTGTVLDQGLGVNPVGGWLLANHLDQALLLYAPDGSSLGELALGVATTSTALVVRWTAPPHRVLRSIDATLYPQLARFVAAALLKSPVEFQTLLRVIDSTLWTVDPLGSRTDQHLSVLVGRPLALVSVQLKLAVYGPLQAGADWAAAPLVPSAPVPRLSVRLGNQASREDGVIGYFAEGEYATFHSVAAPMAFAEGSSPFHSVAATRPTGSPQDYVHQIGPLDAAPGAGNYLTLPLDGCSTASITLLVDPRASIHATTGLLPVKKLELPRQFVDKPLATMELTFRVGPLLARLKPAPTPVLGSAPVPTQNLNYLPLSENKGTWSWWEKVANANWQPYGLAAATESAAAPATASTAAPATASAAVAAPGREPATLREGYLQFLPRPDPT